MNNHFLIALALAGASLGAHADEAATPWSMRAGYATVHLGIDSTVSIGGAHVPGGSVKVADTQVFAAEAGYALTDRWTARFVVAQLPTARVKVDGTLSGMVPPLSGTLGQIIYAPLVLTATYQLADWQGIKPYVGAGLNYTIAHKTRDGDIRGLSVDNTGGPVIQAGVDVALRDRWSLYLDVRKVYLKAAATGTVPLFGGAPARADATISPVLVSAGVGYRF